MGILHENEIRDRIALINRLCDQSDTLLPVNGSGSGFSMSRGNQQNSDGTLTLRVGINAVLVFWKEWLRWGNRLSWYFASITCNAYILQSSFLPNFHYSKSWRNTLKHEMAFTLQTSIQPYIDGLVQGRRNSIASLSYVFLALPHRYRVLIPSLGDGVSVLSLTIMRVSNTIMHAGHLVNRI